MNPVRSDLAPLVGTERVACVLRLAVGVLMLAMTIAFDPAVSWLAVAGVVVAVGWSGLMFLALRSDLPSHHLVRLAGWSYWFDIVLALTVYGLFLNDPVATPVAGLPLLAYRLASRYGTAGVVAGAVTFVGLVGARIAFTRITAGEFLVRPPMLFAWALVATVVLMLAAETRARALAGRPQHEEEGGPESAVPAAAPEVTPLRSPALPPAALTGDERLDSLAACLSLKLEMPQPIRLTDRELEILVLLGKGLGYGAIAGQLFISQSTVRNHVHNLRGKLDVDDREELLLLARAVAARSEPAPPRVMDDPRGA